MSSSARVDSGELDLALVIEGSQHGRLASFELTDSPFHLLLEDESRLSRQEALTIKLLDDVPWILFARQVHPHLYERLVNRADTVGVTPKSKHHVTNAEHAAQLVRRTGGIAFLTHYGASRVASDGLTHLPLAEPDLRLRSVVVARIDAGRVVSEFVRATVKRVKKLSEPIQGRLPLTGS